MNMKLKCNFLWYKVLEYSPIIIITLIGLTSALAIFMDYFQLIKKINLIVAIFSIIFLILYFLRIQLVKDFYYISLTNDKYGKNWSPFGNCGFDTKEKCFYVAGRPYNSNYDSLFFYNDCITWSNYKFTFDFKIVNVCFGALIRTLNRSNFVMLQINLDKIKPHIRINDNYAKFEVDQTKLNLTDSLSIDEWYKCIIICNRTKISIKIKDKKKIILDKHWEIPEANLSVDNTKTNLPINFYYGTIGFKASRAEEADLKNREEKAYFRNVLISKI